MPQHHNNKKKNKRKNHTTTTDTNNNTEIDRSSPASSITTPSEDDLATQINAVKLDNNDEQCYKIANSPKLGRYLVAARNLKAGDVIIKELPLVIGPCGEPVCLGCYQQLPPRNKRFKCLGCGWPMCGSKCIGQKTKNGHSTWECSMLREKRVADYLDRSTAKDMINLYEAIVPFRCLLLKLFAKEQWEELNKMEAHNDIRRTVTSLWNRNQTVVVDQIRNAWGFKEFTEDEIHTVCGILEVNCFEIGQNGARARALYDRAFLLSHDCVANTSHTDNPKTYEMTIRILRDLVQDEPITLSYAYTLQGTLKRREHLQEGKFFWCECDRCKDPTELGTNSSAIQCPKCKNGIILSTDPLKQDAIWKCQSCDYIVTGDTMLKLVDTVFKQLDAIDGNDVVAFEEFLLKYRNVFHKNHYLCICAKHSLFQLYGRSDGYLIHQMTIEQLKTKEQYCRDMLEVVEKLEPGLSKLKGLIFYELHAPVMIQATRQFEEKKINSTELKHRLREVVKLLKDSEKILVMEPEGSDEHTMAQAAKDALKRIGKV